MEGVGWERPCLPFHPALVSHPRPRRVNHWLVGGGGRGSREYLPSSPSAVCVVSCEHSRRPCPPGGNGQQNAGAHRSPPPGPSPSSAASGRRGRPTAGRSAGCCGQGGAAPDDGDIKGQGHRPGRSLFYIFNFIKCPVPAPGISGFPLSVKCPFIKFEKKASFFFLVIPGHFHFFSVI